MTAATCPHCHGSVRPGEERCRWCGAPLPEQLLAYQPGDVLRIRNPFKGGREEEVTVVRVERGGHGLEVRDGRGMIWGYIKPADVLATGRRGKREE